MIPHVRTLGVGSWWADDLTVDNDAGLLGALAFGTRADRCNGGWLVVPVKRWRR